MKQKISSKTVSLVFSVLVICFSVGFYVFAAWKEPASNPPDGNVGAPINVGSVTQVKDGGLGINGAFTTVSTTVLAANAGTNVGIGVAVPTSKLDVSGTVKATGLQITGGAPGAGKILTSDASGVATWQAAAGGGSVSTAQNIRTTNWGVFTGVNAEVNYAAGWVDLPAENNLSVTVASGKVLIIFSGEIGNRASGESIRVALYRDATLLREYSETGWREAVSFQYLDTGVSAGAHTYKLKLYRDACNGTLVLVSCTSCANNATDDGACIFASAQSPAILTAIEIK